MPDPFIAWIELVEDRVSIFIDYGAEVCFARLIFLRKYIPKMTCFKEFCLFLVNLGPPVSMKVIETLVTPGAPRVGGMSAAVANSLSWRMG